jgi:chromosome segregation ATPase
LNAELNRLTNRLHALEREHEKTLADTAALNAKELARAQELATLREVYNKDRAAWQADRASYEATTHQIMTLRRKVEEHRRIYVIQRSEMGLLRDKLAHLRQRYLALCAEQVQLLKAQPSTSQEQFRTSFGEEIRRLEQEEADYQAAQPGELAEDAHEAPATQHA